MYFFCLLDGYGADNKCLLFVFHEELIEDLWYLYLTPNANYTVTLRIIKRNVKINDRTTVITLK
jgi:hypothetical protein